MPYPDVCPECGSVVSHRTSYFGGPEGVIRLSCPVCQHTQEFETEPPRHAATEEQEKV